MHHQLSGRNGNIRKVIIDSHPEEIIVSNEDLIWNHQINNIGHIEISPGASLTINCTVEMAEEAKIVVKPGGKLIVNGGILTSADLKPWMGIYVEGNSWVPQTAENQGQVILTDAVIENAKEAIQIRSESDNWHYNGGIVKATRSVFQNNQRDVSFYAYKNINQEGLEINNTSYFTDCVFETNDNSIFSSYLDHVTLWSVRGVRFNSCQFNENRTSPPHPSRRRQGIYTVGAGINVYYSSFTGLTHGIYAQGGLHPFIVRRSNFSSFKGIYFNDLNFMKILENEFLVLPQSDYGYSGWERCNITYGIYIDHSTGFHIEANTLESTMEVQNDGCGTVGIIANNTNNWTNEIYRNFINKFTVGLETIGINRGFYSDQGLELRCNIMSNNEYDFFVSEGNFSGDTTFLGISKYQGSHSSGDQAANQFGNDSPILTSNFINEGQPIYYYAVRDGFNHIPILYENNIHINQITTEIEQCPSNLPLIPKSELLAEIQETSGSIQILEESLKEVVDDGSTELLVQQVDMANDFSAYTDYIYLMGLSPYLSDEVLLTLGAKEEGFSLAMIRDVLVANPQSAKSDQIMSVLDQRISALPDYMLNQINKGKDFFGEKEIIEMELSSYKRKHDFALDKLIAYSIQENDIQLKEDLKLLLTLSPDVKHRYLLAEWLFSENQPEEAINLLNNLQQEFPDDEIDFDEAHEFYTNLNLWKQNNPALNDLSPEAIHYLNNLFLNSRNLAGKALTLLILNNSIDYEEPAFLPEPEINTYSAPANTETNQSEDNSLKSFSLFPNPGKNYVTVSWCSNDEALNDGKIIFTDINGEIKQTLHINSSCNQELINVTQWKSGHYQAKIITSSGTQGQESFIIIK